MSRNRISIAVLLMLLPSAYADETEQIFNLSLSELLDLEIETASKKVQKADEVAASVFVISREDIKEGGFKNIGQALNTVPGMHINVDYNVDSIMVRGLPYANDKILFLVDGQVMTSKGDNLAVFNQAAPVNIHEIKRIEVIMGPGSALYGSGAFVGIVNVLTEDATAGLRINLDADNVGSKSMSMSYGFEGDGYSFAINASLLDSDGDELKFEFPNGRPPEYTATNGVANEINRIEDEKFSAKLQIGDWNIRMQYSDAKLVWPTSSYWTDFNSLDNYSSYENRFIQAKYPHEYSDTLSASVRFYYNDTDQIWHGVYDDVVFETPSGNPDWHYGGQYYGVEYQLFYNPTENLSLVSGIEYTDNPEVYSIDSEISFTNASLYTVMDYQFNEKLSLNAGARIEKYSFRDSVEFIPKAALLYKPQENTVFKLLYGRAFLAPSAWELQVASLVGNDDLKPELFDSYELIYQHIFERWSSSIALYSSQISDKREIFDTGFADTSYAYNSNENKKLKGVDWSGTFMLGEKSSLKLGLAYADTEEVDNITKQTQAIYGSSEFMAYANLRLPVESGVLTLHAKHIKSPQSHPQVRSWTSVDTIFFAEDIWGLEMQVKIGNLFDEDTPGYTTISTRDVINSIPAVGRYFALGLSKRF